MSPEQQSSDTIFVYFRHIPQQVLGHSGNQDLCLHEADQPKKTHIKLIFTHIKS